MKSWTLTRFLKSLTGLLILATITVIVILFIRRTGGGPAVQPVVPEKKAEKVAASQDIRHLEVTKGERGNFEINADRHFLGEDGRYHLEGNVKYVSFREEGLEISAENADYDSEMTRFNLTGRVVLKQNDFSVTSANVVYDAGKEIVSTTNGVKFEAERLSGTSRNLTYNVIRKTLFLDTNVDVTILPDGEDSAPIRIESENFEYDSGLKSGTFGGGIKLVRDRDSARADVLRFKLVKTEERIRDVVFKGGARVVFRSSTGEAAWEASYFQLPTDTVVIEADELIFRGFPDSPLIHQVLASGGCRFLFGSQAGSTTEISGDEVRFFLMRNGELREFSAVRGALLSARDESGRELRSVRGNRLLLKGPRGLLTADGSPQNPARFFSAGRDITADSITVDLKKSDFEAQGSLKMVISGETDRPEGLFRKDAPVFITADKMRYSDRDHRFTYMQDVKVWQDKQQLFGQKFIMDTESQEILCSGKVSSTFVAVSENNQDGERISISADDMVYNPDEKALLFQKEGLLLVRNIEVKAPSISLTFKAEGGIKLLTATGGVAFQSDQHEGTADRSDYDMEKETIVFTGNPVIKDKEKGTLQGDKLTFYLADDRIVVENLGLRRSVTVIKS
jgi:lipopolysaccharide transport protein LptA